MNDCISASSFAYAVDGAPVIVKPEGLGVGVAVAVGVGAAVAVGVGVGTGAWDGATLGAADGDGGTFDELQPAENASAIATTTRRDMETPRRA
jgi:hypothetical protein